MLQPTKNNPYEFGHLFAFSGSSNIIEDANGYAVLLCVAPLRVTSSMMLLVSSHAKAALKTTLRADGEA